MILIDSTSKKREKETHEISEEEIKRIEKALIKVVGPIGSIICEDTLKLFQEDQNIPNDIETFCKVIKDELGDEKQFENFKQFLEQDTF